MKALLTSTALILGLISSAGVYAAAPAGATGLCKDGTYNMGATKQGACRGHKGIQDWYAATGTTTTVTTTASPVKATKTMTTTSVATTGAMPAGATGLCKDGTYNMGANKQGACRGHKGIQTWYATGTSAAAMTAAPTMAPAKTTTSTSMTTTNAAPAGATGLCNDGSSWTGANKQGACRGHKGIKDWYGSAATGAAVGATAAVTAPAAAPAPEKKGMFSFLNKKPAPATTTAPVTTTTTSTNATTTTRAATPVAAGGGAGQVWVNSDSNVYHCQGSQWYGKTKTGQYMTEAAAQAAGARADHGKACH